MELFTDDNGKKAAQFIGVYVLLAVAASGSQGLMIWWALNIPCLYATLTIHRQIMIKIVITSGLGLHKILVQTVINAPMHFFAEVDSGVILNRFSQDMTLVDAVLPTMAFGTVLSRFGQTYYNPTLMFRRYRTMLRPGCLNLAGLQLHGADNYSVLTSIVLRPESLSADVQTAPVSRSGSQKPIVYNVRGNS